MSTTHGSARSGVDCAWCGKELKHTPWLECPTGETWPDLAACQRHADSRGRKLVKGMLGHGHLRGGPRVYVGYSYLLPGQLPGYERNGVFCTLRCGFAFGGAAHRAGYRITNGGGG